MLCAEIMQFPMTLPTNPNCFTILSPIYLDKITENLQKAQGKRLSKDPTARLEKHFRENMKLLKI
jgi:CRISPR/Cas system endoribonuclease Cas6 (RAMP superfamily)